MGRIDYCPRGREIYAFKGRFGFTRVKGIPIVATFRYDAPPTNLSGNDSGSWDGKKNLDYNDLVAFEGVQSRTQPAPDWPSYPQFFYIFRAVAPCTLVDGGGQYTKNYPIGRWDFNSWNTAAHTLSPIWPTPFASWAAGKDWTEGTFVVDGYNNLYVAGESFSGGGAPGTDDRWRPFNTKRYEVYDLSTFYKTYRETTVLAGFTEGDGEYINEVKITSNYDSTKIITAGNLAMNTKSTGQLLPYYDTGELAVHAGENQFPQVYPNVPSYRQNDTRNIPLTSLLSWGGPDDDYSVTFFCGLLKAGTVLSVQQSVTVEDEYTLDEMRKEAQALLDGRTFADSRQIPWNQGVVLGYNPDGTKNEVAYTILPAIDPVNRYMAAKAERIESYNGLALRKVQWDICGAFCKKTIFLNTLPTLCDTIIPPDCLPTECDAPAGTATSDVFGDPNSHVQVVAYPECRCAP